MIFEKEMVLQKEYEVFCFLKMSVFMKCRGYSDLFRAVMGWEKAIFLFRRRKGRIR